jgi:hypothetical protein
LAEAEIRRLRIRKAEAIGSCRKWVAVISLSRPGEDENRLGGEDDGDGDCETTVT